MLTEISLILAAVFWGLTSLPPSTLPNSYHHFCSWLSASPWVGS